LQASWGSGLHVAPGLHFLGSFPESFITVIVAIDSATAHNGATKRLSRLPQSWVHVATRRYVSRVECCTIGRPPLKLHADYAKFELDEPPLVLLKDNILRYPMALSM